MQQTQQQKQQHSLFELESNKIRHELFVNSPNPDMYRAALRFLNIDATNDADLATFFRDACQRDMSVFKTLLLNNHELLVLMSSVADKNTRAAEIINFIYQMSFENTGHAAASLSERYAHRRAVAILHLTVVRLTVLLHLPLKGALLALFCKTRINDDLIKLVEVIDEIAHVALAPADAPSRQVQEITQYLLCMHWNTVSLLMPNSSFAIELYRCMLRTDRVDAATIPEHVAAEAAHNAPDVSVAEFFARRCVSLAVFLLTEQGADARDQTLLRRLVFDKSVPLADVYQAIGDEIKSRAAAIEQADDEPSHTDRSLPAEQAAAAAAAAIPVAVE